MYQGTGKGGVKKPEDLKPKLRGPSKPTRQKMKGGYTNTSGVLKDMHLGFLTFDCAPVAEHRAVMREVVSSTPAGPTLRVLK